MLEIISIPLLVFANVVFASRRLLQYLRFLQQEEYDSKRFFRWILENRFFDSKASIFLVASSAIAYFLPLHGTGRFFLLLAVTVFLPLIAFTEKDPRSQGKIRLRMTDRAKRIYRIAISSYALLAFIIVPFALRIRFGSAFERMLLGEMFVVQLMPLTLIFAVLGLSRGEKKLQQGFIDQAKKRLAEVDPFVIGITGSYGKTSTKAILGRMLDAAVGPTFWPSKGINTEMGITRSLREELQDAHQYAVIEMGAYREGSIAKLCRLTPPKAAIVTAVGLMHLDRMGSAEQVLLAKSELAQAVPEEGTLVCNGDNEGAREIARRHPKKTTILYGLEPEKGGLSLWASEISFSPEGTHFTLHWQDQQYQGFTPLHGRPALSNVLASVAMAASLGASIEYLLAGIRNLEPVNNRLEVVPAGQGLQINDAYNSNPVGFAAALEVLQALPANRRVLVTPGMIELGEQQYAENLRIAEMAGKICDTVFVVGSLNREALLEGLTKAGLELGTAIELFETRDEALANLAKFRAAGDVVLLENDLPDLYELDIRL